MTKRVNEKKPKKFNLNSKIVSALRKIWRFSPERLEAIRRARSDVPKHLVCEMCGDVVHEKLCSVDHKSPVTLQYGFTTWDNYIERLFCSSDNLAIICESRCHKEKTRRENEERKKNKKLLSGR